MKIIDLLDKIAKGEEVPKKIIVFGEEFIFEDNDYYSINSSAPLISYTGEDYLKVELNCEVEIIKEDEKIKKLEFEEGNIEDKLFLARYITHNRAKINELIDEVNKLKGEK